VGAILEDKIMEKNQQYKGLINAKPKSTLMNKRAKKPANKTGKQPMVYPSGKT
jgi:hypothetical protein